MFRNFRAYRLHSEWPETEDALSKQLEKSAFIPCGALTERSAGWEAPGGEFEPSLARRVGGADLMRLRVQSKVLPGAAINEALEERVVEFKRRTMRDPSRKEKRDLKDEVQVELLPKALLRSQRVWVSVLLKDQLLLVDSASEAMSDLATETLRDALGSLLITPLLFEESLGTFLTKTFLGRGRSRFRPGRECRMYDPAVGRASVSWMDIELADAAVQQHVRDGLQLDRLEVSYDDELTCVLDGEAVVRKLKLAGVNDDKDAELDEHPLAQLDAQFVLTTGAIGRLLDGLAKQLGGYA